MTMPRPVDTFVIRLWSPADHAADAGDGPRGVARHVGTGRAAAFRSADELLALLRELPERGDDGVDLDHDDGSLHPDPGDRRTAEGGPGTAD
jgi:hypothetical protein